MGMFYPIQTLLQAHAGNPQRCERSGRSMSRILALTAPTLVWEAVLICGCCDKRCVPSSKQTTGTHTHPETQIQDTTNQNIFKYSRYLRRFSWLTCATLYPNRFAVQLLMQRGSICTIYQIPNTQQTEQMTLNWICEEELFFLFHACPHFIVC